VALHDLDFDAIKSREKSKEALLRELKGMAEKARRQITKDYVVFPVLSGLAAVAADLAAKAVRESRSSRRRRTVRGVVTRLRSKNRRGDGRMASFGAHPIGDRAALLSLIARQLADSAPVFARTFRATLKADVTASVVRNVWAYAIIFCGHFPDQTYTFSQKEVEDETRGGFYVRQLLGAANIEGTPLFHVLSGNLGYQVEHHLYPDMPSTRYAEIAPRVKELCERYELPYNTGPFGKQLATVQRTILRLAFPGGKPREKPGPYRGPDAALAPVNGNGKRREPTGQNGSGPEQATAGVRVDMPDEAEQAGAPVVGSDQSVCGYAHLSPRPQRQDRSG